MNLMWYWSFFSGQVWSLRSMVGFNLGHSVHRSVPVHSKVWNGELVAFSVNTRRKYASPLSYLWYGLSDSINLVLICGRGANNICILPYETWVNELCVSQQQAFIASVSSSMVNMVVIQLMHLNGFICYRVL